MRAHAAFVVWIATCGLLVLVAVLIVASVLAGSIHTPPATLLAAPALLWIATWVGLTFGTVWWYRRGIAAAAASPDLEQRERAGRLMQVRPIFVGRNLSGVDLAGLPETRVARWLHSWWPMVCHLVGLALVLLAAAGSR
ncbi:hypothetical protein SAMN04489720_2552 [Agrococcus jejuensis]|uniref:Uncharacterized protein n=2 Tax=Agrococcus jejuensis TaxID=399736 RepID=A0A1G8FNX4_9MICO|nr:hypothetical protein SAMN04489720_2552 [Agrococcus jejuensis]